MIKFKFFTDFEKEEKWLCDMAEKGYQLVGVYFWYTFIPAPPEKATIRIDYRTFKNNRDFSDYCTLFEDSGWRHIAGKKQNGPQYFKKMGAAGDDDIFSDSFSRAGRYKRLSNMWLTFTAIWAPFAVVSLTSGWMKTDGFLDPKSLYLTPGLWEMSGPAFWGAFWFETPFALMRGFSLIFWIAIILLYIFFALKSWWLYKKTLNGNLQ
jgi:hypothetical protein